MTVQAGNEKTIVDEKANKRVKSGKGEKGLVHEKKLQRRNTAQGHEHLEELEWPQWNTLRRWTKFCLLGHRREPSRPLLFTLRIEPKVKGYSVEVPKNVLFTYQDTVTTLNRIRRRLYDDSPNGHVGNSLQQQVGKGIIMAVVGSNYIDNVGCGATESTKLCEAVLGDERLMYQNISPRSQEYRQRLEHIIRTEVPQSDHRKRREVVNHMAAFCYLASKFVGEGEEFSEALIKTTHRILCRNLDKTYRNDTDSKSRPGKYRKEDLYANTFKFPPFKKVRNMMRKFVKSLNSTLRHAENNPHELDPVYLASAASAHFVNIHPFLSGNGRMCRMILNVILLKYTGVAVAMGGDERERKNYLSIAARRSHAGKGDGELARYSLMRVNRSIKAVERGLATD